MKSYTVPTTRMTPGQRTTILMALAVRESRKLGHRPGTPLPDSEVNAAITSCEHCGCFVCVDLAESPEPYGSGVTEPCSRRGGRRW